MCMCVILLVVPLLAMALYPHGYQKTNARADALCHVKVNLLLGG